MTGHREGLGSRTLRCACVFCGSSPHTCRSVSGLCAFFLSAFLSSSLPPSLRTRTAGRGGSSRACPASRSRTATSTCAGARPRRPAGGAACPPCTYFHHTQRARTHRRRGALESIVCLGAKPKLTKPLRTLSVAPPCALALILACALAAAVRSIMATHRVAGAWRRRLSRGTWASSANTDHFRLAVRLLRAGLRVQGTLSRWRRCCGAGMSGSTWSWSTS